MKALLVIDMQEDYVGEKRNVRRFPYDSETLIRRVNRRIEDCENEGDVVVHILNRLFYQSKRFTPRVVEGLNVVSDLVFIKNRASCFSNSELVRLLHKSHVTGLEMVGVDGNLCVAASARAGVKNGFSVAFNQHCIEAAKKDQLRKTISGLQDAGVIIQG